MWTGAILASVDTVIVAELHVARQISRTHMWNTKYIANLCNNLNNAELFTSVYKTSY